MAHASLKYSFSIPETTVSIGFLDHIDPNPLPREALEFALKADADAVPDGGRLVEQLEKELQKGGRLRGAIIFPFWEDAPLTDPEIRRHASPPSLKEEQAKEREVFKDREVRIHFDRWLQEEHGRAPELIEAQAFAAECARAALLNQRYLIASQIRLRRRKWAFLSEMVLDGDVEAYLPRADPDEPGCVIPLGPLEQARARLKPVYTDEGIYLPLGYVKGLPQAGALGLLRRGWQKLFILPMEEYRSALRAYILHSIYTVPALEQILSQQHL